MRKIPTHSILFNKMRGPRKPLPPKRSKTLAELTTNFIDAPWPPVVLDRKMTKRQREISALPRKQTPADRREERAAKIAYLKEEWRKAG